MSDENIVIDGFGEIEKDAIGEIMNITMGSAATAVSTMLSAKVWITTPTVSVAKAEKLSFPELDPAIMVKIKYIKGVEGQNVLLLKQGDVQLILDQLMGLPLEVTDDFQFDEMNISAICEVMNQMMGASATALSEIINTSVDISTPVATVPDEITDQVGKLALFDLSPEQTVVSIKFNLTIDGVINSEFISILTIGLAKEMADKMMAGYNSEPEPAPTPAPTPAPIPTPPPSGGSSKNLSQDEIEKLLRQSAESAASPPPASPPQQPVPQQQMQQPYGIPPQNMQQPYGAMYQQPPMYPQNMYQQPYGYQQPQAAMNIQPVQFQNFSSGETTLSQEQSDNLKLLMNVPLNVTVEIGSTNRKVKEILEFTQGTIIELERQAGAPVDVIVNGNLIAKGDVVVIDDNFAVRITEIVKSKFLDDLSKE